MEVKNRFGPSHSGNVKPAQGGQVMGQAPESAQPRHTHPLDFIHQLPRLHNVQAIAFIAQFDHPLTPIAVGTSRSQERSA